MGFRLLIFLLLVLLAPAGCLMVVKREKLGAMSGGLMKLPDIPAPTTPKAMAELQLEAPLGLLLLDRSASMKTTDPDFIQSLASEVFTFFFAHLIKRDTAAASQDKIHLAAMLYSQVKYQDLPLVAGLDISAMTWPGAKSSDKRLLRIDASAAGPDTAMKAVTDRFDKIMGTKGRDQREGGTPHDIVGPATEQFVREYRQQFGASAEVYVVYMTDAGGDPQFGPAQSYILQHVPGVHLAAAPLEDKNDTENLIPRFLKALQLDEIDATSDALGNGFDMATMGNRPVPFFITARDAPKVVTDTGVSVPVHGRNGMFYGICDPADPQFANARLLRVDSKWGVDRVRVFRRPWWELKLEPHYYDMLDDKGVPNAVLSFTSNQKPADISPKPARIETSTGQKIADMSLSWDNATSTFTGQLPDAAALPMSESEFTLVCSPGGGKELRLPFTVLRAVRLRFVDTQSGKTSRTADYLPYYPMSQKP